MSVNNMQFSVATHMMAALGYHHGSAVTSSVLAESVNVDPSFIRRALSRLSKAGLVKTTRGRNGACALSRSPERITLLEIYRASGAPATFPIHGYPVEKGCPISVSIKGLMADVLDEAQTEFEASLQKRTVADLVKRIPKKK